MASAHILARNPEAYIPQARTVWRVILAPWALGMTCGISLTAISALARLSQGRIRESMAAVGITVVLAAGVIVLTWFPYVRPFLHRRLAREGESTPGTITKTEYHRFANGPKHYVRYRFRAPNGGKHAGLESITPDAFDRLKVGDPLDVWYLPSIPFVNVPAPFCEYSRLDGQAYD